MNLYLLTQNESDDYDTYDECVVAADSPEDAALINPRGEVYGERRGTAPAANRWRMGVDDGVCGNWASHPRNVSVKLIGTAAEGVRGVVCASYNAG